MTRPTLGLTTGKGVGPLSNAVRTSLVEGLIDVAQPLAKGRQSEVFSVAGRPGLVYKRYRSDVKVDIDLMLELIELPSNLRESDRSHLESHCGWPISLVVNDDAKVDGLLLRRATDEFFTSLDGEQLPRSLDWLYCDPATASSMGLVERVRVVRSTVRSLGILHGLGMSHGDISDNNVLWSTASARAFLLDCDGVSRGSVGPVSPRPHGTAQWLDPDVTDSRLLSDRYQVALLFWRAFLNDHGNLAGLRGGGTISVPQIPLPGSAVRPADHLNSEMGDLLARALQPGRPGARPTMDEWDNGLARLEASVLAALKPTAANTSAPGVRRRASTATPPPTPPPPPPSQAAAEGAAATRPSPTATPTPTYVPTRVGLWQRIKQVFRSS